MGIFIEQNAPSPHIGLPDMNQNQVESTGDIASKLNALERWLSEGLITQENYEITKDRLTNEFMTETEPANKPKIEDFIGPEIGYTEEELQPDLWASLLKKHGEFIKPPMFGVEGPKNINQPWKRHLDLGPRLEYEPHPKLGDKYDLWNRNTPQQTAVSQQTAPVQSFPVSGIPSYTYTPEGREGYSYGLAKGGKVPPSILKGILSLLGNKVPKWLTNLINKTKGADKYVEKIIKPEEYSDINKPALDLMSRWLRETDVVKKEKLLQETVDKLKDSDKIATSMEEEVKRMTEQVDDLNQKIKLLNPDDDEPTYHAKGGIKFDKGLWQSLMSLGESMGISPKEQLKTFIKIGIPIPDKLKQKWGITEADLEFKEPAEGLEWLILKDNPDLAKQPYSESKVNKMLSDEFEEIDKVPIQGDLFEKKNGGLISLIS